MALLLWLALAIFPACLSSQSPTALSELAAQIREAGLDPDECYRVRDLDFTREDARIYLTDGFLIFGKAVNGRRFSAVFIGEIDGGDAEILLFPPLRSERMSLAKFTESPNLSEHFRFAAFLFTDDTHTEVVKKISEGYGGRKVPDVGPMYAERHNAVVKNLSESLELRLVSDLLDDPDLSAGFFFASLRGLRLGTFDFVLDFASRKGIRIGQFSIQQRQPFFDMWTEFEPRSVTSGRREAQGDPYSVEHFEIDARLMPDLHLRATTTMRLIPRSERKTIAMLLAQEMKVTAARVGDVELEVYRPSAARLNSFRRDRDSVFLVRLPHSAKVGEAIDLVIEHEGKVIQSSGNEVYFVDSRGSWYPGGGFRFATFDLTFRLPKELDFVATSDSAEVTIEGDTAVHRVSVSEPVRTFGFNIGKYKTITMRRNGFTVNVMANQQIETALEPKPQVVLVPSPPVATGRRTSTAQTLGTIQAVRPNPTQRLREMGTEVVNLLEIFSERFGPPPIKTINVSPIPGNFGQGFAGMIYLSTITYLPEGQRPAYARDSVSKTFFSDLLLAHELSHQWWGNLVFSDSDQDEWLMEGLATYTALMMLEQQKGSKAMLEVLRRYRDNLLADLGEGRTIENAGPIIWGQRLVNSRDRNAWMTITYEKGAWIYHMLRSRMGDERFGEMLKELPQRFRHKPLSTAAFREFAAEFMPAKSDDADLEEFFAQWVEGTGIPKLAITTKVTGAPPKVRVELG